MNSDICCCHVQLLIVTNCLHNASVNSLQLPLFVFQSVVLRLYIDTDIRFRYARTTVSTRVSNPANTSQQLTFSFVLPGSAYISGFHM